MRRYFTLPGGHPEQEQPLSDRAIFGGAYAVISRSVLQDIATS